MNHRKFSFHTKVSMRYVSFVETMIILSLYAPTNLLPALNLRLPNLRQVISIHLPPTLLKIMTSSLSNHNGTDARGSPIGHRSKARSTNQPYRLQNTQLNLTSLVTKLSSTPLLHHILLTQFLPLMPSLPLQSSKLTQRMVSS